MSWLQRRRLIIGLLLLLPVLAWLSSRWPSGGQSATANAASPNSKSAAGLELSESRLSHYDPAGHLLWTLHAPLMRYRQQAQEGLAQDAWVQFFSAGRPSLGVRAGRLVFFNRSGDLLLSGRLSAQEQAQGLRFQTEAARWSDSGQVLRGSGPLELERQNLKLTGQGFSYWPRQDQLVVQSAALRFWPEGR